MDTGEVPGYEFEVPRGPRHRTRQDSLRPFPQDSLRPFPQDSLRPLRRAAPAMPPPRASARAAGGVLAVMRTRNWLVGLVLPIVVAVIVGIAVVVTAGGGGNGGAAPSALAAGFPPARLAGTAFTGTAGTTRVMLAAIAASAGTEVLAGTADGGPALWVSPDGGSAWTRAALAGAGSGQLAGIAHGAAGWLAVGTALRGAGRGGPLIVSSPDARAWTVAGGASALGTVPAGSGSAGAVTAAAAGSRKGFVIVGHRATRGDAVTAAVWYAPGLAGWRAAAIAGKAGQGQTQMSAVTATARGFAAVGAAGARPAAWLSADGRTWRQPVLAAPAGAARAALAYVAARGDVVVAAGTAFSAAGSGRPFAEVSADSGATWTLIKLPEPDGGRAAAVTALTAAGAGFTAAGIYSTGGGSAVVLWTLPAAGGTGWTTATPQGTGLASSATGPATQNALTALTADGATLTGAGYTGQQAGQEPTLWQSPIRY